MGEVSQSPGVFWTRMTDLATFVSTTELQEFEWILRKKTWAWPRRSSLHLISEIRNKMVELRKDLIL